MLELTFSPPIAGDDEFKDADPRFLAYTAPSTNPIHSLRQLKMTSFTGLRIGR